MIGTLNSWVSKVVGKVYAPSKAKTVKKAGKSKKCCGKCRC